MSHRLTVHVRFEPHEPTAVVECTVHDRAGPELGAGLDALVEHLFGRHDCVRVVTFVHAADEAVQGMWEAAGLRAVAVDGDELVYHRGR